MRKLPEEQQDQLVKMLQAGDKPRVIKKYFKDKYGVILPAWKIQNLKGELKKGRLPKGRLPKDKDTAPRTKDPLEALADIVKYLLQTRDAEKDVILALRLEVLKARNEVFRMKHKLDLEVPEGFEKE